MSSVITDDLAEIKEEIAAEASADPGHKKLGVFFWVCAGFIVLVAVLPPSPACSPAQPQFGELQQRAERRAQLEPLAGNRRPLPRHLEPADLRRRVSLVVGFGGALIGLALGGIPAMYSAYRQGPGRHRLNTGSYVFLAFLAIVAVIAIVSFWGHSLWKITLIIGIFAAPLIFRVVRASTLSYASRDFVLAAKALGASDSRILAREILPNIMPTVVSFGLIAVATIIVLEGSLAFLGLSVQPPTPSWGNMLNEGSSLLTGAKGQTNPWLVIFPATAMFLLLFSLNVVADKLRAYFDVTEIKL